MDFRKKIIDIIILICYVGLIYSTLSLTPALYLSLKNILGPSFGIAVNIFIITIGLVLFILFYKNLKHKRMIVYLGIMIIILIYALLMAYLTPSIGDKEHLLEYGLLSYLALRVFKGMRSRDIKYLYVIGTLVIVGYFDEFIQKFLPNRAYELKDVALNILSGLLGLALIRLLT